MNKENFYKLQQYLGSLGFGKMLTNSDELEKLIAQDEPEFHLSTSTSFNELTRIDATLYFRKSVQRDEHFLLKYAATLHYLNEAGRDISQTFYTYDNAFFSFEEAFNLLEGRYVYKNLISASGDKYDGWLQLNFREKDSQNNFKFIKYRAIYRHYLENALTLYPIQELLNDKLKEELIRSLQKGNLTQVHFAKPNKVEMKYIEANVRNKTINIYSASTKKSKKVSGPERA